MTKTTWLLAASLALNLGLARALALSWRPSAERHDPTDGLAKMPYRHLELSAEQRVALDTERDRLHNSMPHLETALSAGQRDLLDLLAALPPDRQAIGAVQGRIQEQQAAVQQLVIDHLLTILAAMTPDQRSRFQQLLREKMPTGTTFCPGG